jgi:hypothetical protein
LKVLNITLGLFWDENIGLVLGLESPLTYEEIDEMGFSFTPDFLKKNLVTEVDVCVLSSLCSTIALSIGYRFQSNSGKTGLQLLKTKFQLMETMEDNF